MAVNHTENFADPETGAHTQGVESMWNKAKNKKSEIMWNLSTNDRWIPLPIYMWRQQHLNEDVFRRMQVMIYIFDSCYVCI